MQSWYVAKVKVQNESVLQTFLASYDVEVFSPTVATPGVKGGGTTALFPTYVFCYLDPASGCQSPIMVIYRYKY